MYTYLSVCVSQVEVWEGWLGWVRGGQGRGWLVSDKP